MYCTERVHVGYSHLYDSAVEFCGFGMLHGIVTKAGDMPFIFHLGRRCENECRKKTILVASKYNFLASENPLYIM